MWAMYAWPGGAARLFDWASHVSVFTGRTPVLSDMLGFAAVHLVLAGAMLAVPLPARWAARAR